MSGKTNTTTAYHELELYKCEFITSEYNGLLLVLTGYSPEHSKYRAYIGNPALNRNPYEIRVTPEQFVHNFMFYYLTDRVKITKNYDINTLKYRDYDLLEICNEILNA